MSRRLRVFLATAVAVGLLASAGTYNAAVDKSTPPDTKEPTNSAPNPYQTIEHWAKLPDGRKMGSTSAIDIDRDGKSVWVAERCGANSCLDPQTREIKKMDVVFKFDPDGNVLKSFGSGMFVAPHGIYVDKDDNVWVTDYQDNAPPPPGGRGAAARVEPGSEDPRPGATVGNQVYKFSPDGKLLLTIGKAGGAAVPDCCYQPNDVIVAPNGDIFVSEGHGSGKDVVFKFDKTGKPIKHWGEYGTGPGQFDQPHSLAFDGKGRLYIADRNNNRVQIFDQDGNYISEVHQWSRPSGIFIDIKHNMLCSADSESESVSLNHNGWHRGLRCGSLKDGKIAFYIPDPNTKTRAADNYNGTSAAEGVAVDAQGNIYGAEVGPQDVKKYVKK